jgi:hypothetical protein
MLNMEIVGNYLMFGVIETKQPVDNSIVHFAMG